MPSIYLQSSSADRFTIILFLFEVIGVTLISKSIQVSSAPPLTAVQSIISIWDECLQRSPSTRGDLGI